MAKNFEQLACKDATKDLVLIVRECHVLGALTKGTSKDLRKKCMLYLAGKDMAEVEDIRVDRNIVRILFKGAKTWTRYQSTPTIRNLVQTNDRTIVKGLRKMGATVTWPKDGIPAVLKVPRKAISLEHMRSAEFKDKRKASLERRKGQPKRSHNPPDALTLQGIRNGRGLGLG